MHTLHTDFAVWSQALTNRVNPFVAFQLRSPLWLFISINTVYLKNRLRNIYTNSFKLLHGRLLEL